MVSFDIRFKKYALGFIIALASVLSAMPEEGRAKESKFQSLYQEIDRLAGRIEPEVIEWRRDFHQNPELSNREFRTSRVIAERLRELGLEVTTGIAHTGVVGVLKGQKDEPVVALRADMDALPVTEKTGLPYASTATAMYEGKEVGVMHACGHDNHMAILLGAAKILRELKDELPGTVKFIFQPCEEGAPQGEEGGAYLMVKEGVLKSPDVDAIFGLHVIPGPIGRIAYREGGFMASSDRFEITVKGQQTHGATPWSGKDPIVSAAQIVLGLQTIVSRQTDLTQSAAVVTIGQIRGGIRSNIIPEEVKLVGTIRALDPQIREQLHQDIEHKAKLIAESAGTTAEVKIARGNGVTYNDPDLMRKMAATLQRVAGKDNAVTINPVTLAEDYAAYAEQVPALFFHLGITPPGGEFIPNHSPYFYVDESALKLGVRALCSLAVDYMAY